MLIGVMRGCVDSRLSSTGGRGSVVLIEAMIGYVDVSDERLGLGGIGRGITCTLA